MSAPTKAEPQAKAAPSRVTTCGVCGYVSEPGFPIHRCSRKDCPHDGQSRTAEPQVAAHTPTTHRSGWHARVMGVPRSIREYEVRNASGSLIVDDLDESDAILIAAAPELLEALRSMVREFSRLSGTCGTDAAAIGRARAAIARATEAKP